MKYDFFKLAQDRVEQILVKHKIEIDFKDDDSFADFVSNLDSYQFGSAEKQIIYTYNCMLQTIAFTVESVNFSMEVL